MNLLPTTWATSFPVRRRATMLMLAALLGACAHHEPLPRDLLNPEGLASYRIGAEDQIEVVVWNNPELSRTVPVRPDGHISLPLVNDIRAAGLTPMELREVLIKSFAEYIPNVEVAVILREVNSPTISIYGEVREPGQYGLRHPTRLLEMLAKAGGLTEFASRTDVYILRPTSEGTERISVPHDAMVESAGNFNPFLRPGDTVVVP